MLSKRGKGYRVGDRFVRTLNEVAEVVGVSVSTIEYRMRSGYSFEQAILDRESFLALRKNFLRSDKEDVYVYEDDEYSTLYNLAVAVGVSIPELRVLLIKDMYGGKISISKRTRLEKDVIKKVYYRDGDTTYYTKTSYVVAKKLNMSTFNRYIGLGYSIKDATEKILARKRSLYYDGNWYVSVRELADDEDVRYSRLLTALRENDDIGEAIAYARESGKMQTRRYKKNRIG